MAHRSKARAPSFATGQCGLKGVPVTRFDCPLDAVEFRAKSMGCIKHRVAVVDQDASPQIGGRTTHTRGVAQTRAVETASVIRTHALPDRG